VDIETSELGIDPKTTWALRGLIGGLGKPSTKVSYSLLFHTSIHHPRDQTEVVGPNNTKHVTTIPIDAVLGGTYCLLFPNTEEMRNKAVKL